MSADGPDMGFLQIIRNKNRLCVVYSPDSADLPGKRQKCILSAQAVRLTESAGNCVCHAIEGLCVIPMCFPSLGYSGKAIPHSLLWFCDFGMTCQHGEDWFIPTDSYAVL